MMMSKAEAGKNVSLSPDTARFVALKLCLVGNMPNRTDIVRVLCGAKCERQCYNCIGKANEIVRLYGSSLTD